MRDPINVEDFVKMVENRKKQLGILDSDIEAMRNNGKRRTPEKRKQLARIQRRARRAGLVPLHANF